uniref:PEP-CTERM sorting domain-containing protein n=1 Tax=Cyanothece sp. BG0011 TaxID=2082950 RepID=UPI0018E53D54
SAYLMNASTLSGTWDTFGIEKGNGSAGPDLSHFSVYSSGQPVPEPLTILGAGAAISFGTAFKRKLGKAKKSDEKA